MIVRSVSRYARKVNGPLGPFNFQIASRAQCRRFTMPSSSGASPASGSSSSSLGMLAPFVSELDRVAPFFDIKGSQIQILRTPADFYETLKVRGAQLWMWCWTWS
jgi:CDP-diacylglycerol---glycerol-3-phosphate 3-phosphatidyltransferase